jgi:hypothetical protein
MVSGEYSVQRFVSTAVERGLLRVREIAEGESGLFVNWNSDADRSGFSP